MSVRGHSPHQTRLRRAPELDAGLGWLNSDRPLQIGGELRGQVVVLDFWTYCCINCIHILPDLAFLEEKYKHDPVAFIGVHSAKFPNEASRETIRAAILRYEIAHPVIIDDSMKIWRSYAVRSWPTVVVIDPNGCVAGTFAGEGNREAIDQAVSQSLAQARSAGTLAGGPLEIQRDQSVRAASGLKFPGKVLADEESGRLFVADSNHNRIVIAELPDEDGRARVIKVVGSGEVGMADGPAGVARHKPALPEGERVSFNHPQGLAAGHGKLYVADTENHLIRAIDLETYEVSTVAGTGRMENDRAGGGMGTQQGLNSPWDLAREGSTLYVAMAGTHQIWRIDLPVGFARALAGNGRENLVDGPTETSAFAQPSGICTLGGKLYVADSEVSAIRGIDMASEQVFTVVGEGLFSFGDVDGAAPKAKLQHPLGVAGWGNLLLVADTYNHKIKAVDPGSRSVRTLFGTGQPGTGGIRPLKPGSAGSPDGSVAFFEPGGLSVLGDRLFVADTNNHRVVMVNLKTGEWREVILDGLREPQVDEDAEAVITADAIAIAPGRDVELTIDIQLPKDAYWNAEAPWSVRVCENGETLAQRTGKSESAQLRVVIPGAKNHANGEWRVEVAFASCTSGDGGLCVPHRRIWRVPVAQGDAETVTLKG